MIKKNFTLILVLIIYGYTATFAQSTIARSSITFKIKNLGIETGGTVGGLQATVHFSTGNLTAASIDASVDVKTLSTDNSIRDEHLKSDEFFDVAHYPKILLKSIAIKHRSGNRYTGAFNLTIKNKTKTIEIPFTYTPKADLGEFSGSFKINRLDFGVGEDSMTLSNEVIVNIDAVIND